MNSIRQVTPKEQKQITQLRITEFGRSSEFSLKKPEKLEWNQCDDKHVVLAAWDASGLAVSTMRAVQIDNAIEAASAIECTPPPQVNYPAIIFNSAATRKSHRGLGLNQALRYHFLLSALRGHIQTIISPIYEGAPRIAFMAELGYEFMVPKKNWQTKLAPKRRRIVGLLQRSKMAHALRHLMAQRTDIIRSYPFQGDQFDFDKCRPKPDWPAAMSSL